MAESEQATVDNLVATLRAEIEEIDQNVQGLDEEPEVTLPEGLKALLASAPVTTKIAAAVDEIVANMEPISDDLAAALRAQAREAREVLGAGHVFLEQKATLARTRKSLTVEDIAAAIDIDADTVRAVERGRSAFDRLGEAAVAKWIKVLELDFTDAVHALDRSLRSPAMSYAGDPDEYSRKANEFVEKVRQLLEGDVQPD